MLCVFVPVAWRMFPKHMVLDVHVPSTAFSRQLKQLLLTMLMITMQLPDGQHGQT